MDRGALREEVAVVAVVQLAGLGQERVRGDVGLDQDISVHQVQRVIVLDQVGGGQGTVADAVQTSSIRVDGDGARQLAGRRAPEAVALVKVEVRSNRIAVHGIVRGCVLVEHIGHEVIRCRQHERGVAQAVLRTTGLDGKTSYAADSNCEFANQMPRVSSAYEHTTNTKEVQSRTQSKAKNDQLHLQMRVREIALR